MKLRLAGCVVLLLHAAAQLQQTKSTVFQQQQAYYRSTPSALSLRSSWVPSAPAAAGFLTVASSCCPNRRNRENELRVHGHLSAVTAAGGGGGRARARSLAHSPPLASRIRMVQPLRFSFCTSEKR